MFECVWHSVWNGACVCVRACVRMRVYGGEGGGGGAAFGLAKYKIKIKPDSKGRQNQKKHGLCCCTTEFPAAVHTYLQPVNPDEGILVHLSRALVFVLEAAKICLECTGKLGFGAKAGERAYAAMGLLGRGGRGG